MMTHSVAVVDDDVNVRTILSAVFVDAGYDVTTHPSAEQFLESNIEPDCIVLDMCMDGKTGLELMAEINEIGFITPVVFLTASDDAETCWDAAEMGAVKYLVKPVSPLIVLDEVRKAIEVGETTKNDLRFIRESRERISCLTPREAQVLDLVVRGKPTKVIARRLGISSRTVDSHRKNIALKTNVPEVPRLAVIYYAARHA